MKKIWIFILSVLLLGCSGDINHISSKNIPVDENIAEEASNYVTEGDEIGDGSMVYLIDDNKLKESETVVYPVYLEGELTSFLLCEKEDREVINDSVLTEHYRDNGAYVFVLKDNRLYYCDSDDVYPFEDDIKNVLNSYEIKESTEVIKNRIRLRSSDTVIVDGTEYAAGRIVVVFEDGDTDNMKEDFADFIGGEYRSRIKSLKAYVFTFERKSSSELKSLLESVLELDYVKDAWLDKVNHPNSKGNSQYPDM